VYDNGTAAPQDGTMQKGERLMVDTGMGREIRYEDAKRN